MKITGVYEERLVPHGTAFAMITPEGSKIHILSAAPMGPDILYKFIVIREELDNAK